MNYTYFYYDNKEILIDNQRYYVLRGWNEQKYNGNTYKVPLIDFEITYDEYLVVKMQHLREKKLKRIFSKPE